MKSSKGLNYIVTVAIMQLLKADFFFVNRWILRFAGLWLPDNKNPLIQLLYKIYALSVFLFVNLFFTSTEFISLFYTYKDLNAFIKNINFALTHFMGAIKVIFWFFNGYKLQKIIKDLENIEIDYQSCGKFQPELLFYKYKSIGIRTTLIFFGFAHLTLSSSYIPPTIETLQKILTKTEGKLPENLPYFSWMPFDYHTPKTYLIALGYQAGPMFSYAYSIVGMDTLIMNIMNFIAYHLTLIQGAFLTITDRTLRRKYENMSYVVLTLEDHRAMNKEINRICRHIQIIIKNCKDLEVTQRYLTFCQAGATLFILCTCLYLVSSTPPLSEEFFAEMIYMLAMGFQVFLYCWFGNEVTLKAQEMPVYIWHSDWYATNKQFKNSMTYTMLMMKKPIYFTIGNFLPLTLRTFMSILKTSYSFFAVIKNKD